ncbi:hypothetical protein [Clostridium saccharobutylicum]|uniref:Uncharacterized protein n=1 Tax=Clostridium saccharobutylicum DSM 13864 TaxID=1345695 RepID=U5MYF5_CLOSA|nr:hypothetical protein [Clostridium saccharobutylicum]AGX44497.1 hypothetical protein CLSA_c35360 [Clostridium saccharobutylicum DSM 13864]AQR91791.1 hypothetical protein CLOSC_35190 [Clostridium saccharobutylicum]AQS01693.1 hypothetical protein CSACC_35240 [Clostridium saccharobutylicum]AQS11299.1 hypothetical protein CLOBY_34550 [Clostridium saccharobutylicum]AQS15676.1 hypothetical protein CLOSACC_35240 [Clostridium saccharobutylicum]
MTKMQEIIGKILKSRITREKANNTLNVEEITNTLNIFLAGETITSEQYAEFREMIIPVETDAHKTKDSTDNNTEVNSQKEANPQQTNVQ